MLIGDVVRVAVRELINGIVTAMRWMFHLFLNNKPTEQNEAECDLWLECLLNYFHSMTGFPTKKFQEGQSNYSGLSNEVKCQYNFQLNIRLLPNILSPSSSIFAGNGTLEFKYKSPGRMRIRLLLELCLLNSSILPSDHSEHIDVFQFASHSSREVVLRG